jgi:hypothetical protein
LDALDGQTALLVEAIKEKKFASLHDWVVFLGDLVTLREIRVVIVFSIEFNSSVDISSQCQRSFDS